MKTILDLVIDNTRQCQHQGGYPANIALGQPTYSGTYENTPEMPNTQPKEDIAVTVAGRTVSMSATNWLLALIAFLLFALLISKLAD
ncbi:MAG: hypothetical protein LBN27_11140 [Prevotellaceae bacterium]|jgi:hypothetical protein|nr:hypothetical protein [Prevotellaceae bacterium]